MLATIENESFKFGIQIYFLEALKKCESQARIEAQLLESLPSMLRALRSIPSTIYARWDGTRGGAHLESQH